MKAILILLLLAGALFLFFRCRQSGKTLSNDIPFGPFTIRKTARTGKSYNMNTGIVSRTDVACTILYKGKPVRFSKSMENNTGIPYMWKAMILEGAPTPTLLAGSQTLFLVYEKDGSVVTEPLIVQSKDFASVQWLDSEQGQPGVFQEIYADFDASKLDKIDTLKGGRYLMVNEHSVLDVKTLDFKTYNVDNNDVSNYSFPAPHGALAFSPDKKQIVFRAEFQAWNTETDKLPASGNALVAYDWQEDKGYALPFDDTEYRILRPDDMTTDWFNTRFEWKPVADALHLQPRKLDQLPPWTGRYSERDNYYTLAPVNKAILPAFQAFFLKYMGWSEANVQEDKFHEYTGRRITYGDGKLKFDLCLKEDERQFTFSKQLYENDSAEYTRLVKEIARAFDVELAAGKNTRTVSYR